MTEQDTETMGKQIRRRRIEAGLSQDDLAHLAGVAKTTLRNHEGDQVEAGRRTEDIFAALDRYERGPTIATGGSATAALESVARQFDMLAGAFPDYADDAMGLEALIARTARHAYQHAARIARGEA